MVIREFFHQDGMAKSLVLQFLEILDAKLISLLNKTSKVIHGLPQDMTIPFQANTMISLIHSKSISLCNEDE